VAIDTAGVRKKKSLEHAIELFAHNRSNDSIRRADVCVHMFDVREPISQVDKSLSPPTASSSTSRSSWSATRSTWRRSST
jgi:predicted GTPase